MNLDVWFFTGSLASNLVQAELGQRTSTTFAWARAAGRETRVGDGDHPHAGCGARQDAVAGVLHETHRSGRTPSSSRGLQVDIGRGLAPGSVSVQTTAVNLPRSAASATTMSISVRSEPEASPVG